MGFKGVILAGGKGSRLSPLTDITNKFLMPVYDKLMIEYSVYSLLNAGITDIAIVLGIKSAGETMDYLKSGAKYNCKFTYFYQDQPQGVPHALYQTKNFAGEDNIVVLCADNIIYDNLYPYIRAFSDGAFITCKVFEDLNELKRFAVLKYDENLDVSEIVEKPHNPPSRTAFCGIQIYDKNVWKIIEGLEPSSRGEYEVTDILNAYIKRDKLSCGFLRKPWFDCGNKDSLFKAQEFAYYNKQPLASFDFGWGGR